MGANALAIFSLRVNALTHIVSASALISTRSCAARACSQHGTRGLSLT
jgi:hypothetical protein